MRGVALACLLAACGNEAGLLLDVHPGDSSVARVEVLLPGDQPGKYMGLPPAMTGAKVPGPVYSVVDRTGGMLDGAGVLRVLLTPGDIAAVPAILVLGYDANDTPIRYAVVTDPNGWIALPHTTSTHLVVDLDPITTVPLSNASASTASPRLVRWDGMTPDDATAKCFGILSGNGSGRTGIFFGPDGDLDCDHAQPECDDTWFMHVRNPGKCATTMPPPMDDTMDACRIGDSAGCRDGFAGSNACVAQLPGVCVPAEVCDQCADGLDPSCVAQQMTDLKASHLDCTIYVRTNNSDGSKLFCDTVATTLAMGTLFGSGYTCSGSNGFADPMMPANALATEIPLDAAPGAKLSFNCHAGTTDFAFAVSTIATTGVDPALPETQAALLFGVQSPSTTASPHVLALPLHVQYVDVGVQLCPPEAMHCDLAPDANTQADDPIWHCAGS